MLPDHLKGDVLRGGARITAFLRELLGEPELSKKQVYYWIASKRIPAGKDGADVVASKQMLCVDYARKTGREVA
jgi:hypothetical protein